MKLIVIICCMILFGIISAIFWNLVLPDTVENVKYWLAWLSGFLFGEYLYLKWWQA